MMTPAHILRRLWARGVEQRRRARFARALTHLHGPSTLDMEKEDVLAIVLVRNGSYYMDVFFEHYRRLGVRHFAFIDNGSTDETLQRLSSEPGVVVDQCTLPLAGYEDLLRQHPANTYGRDRWCLYVDMDELFDFEGSAALGLAGLTRYLTAQGATAMMAQMLEMFPKTPLRENAHLSYADAVEAFGYFDISDVRKYDYHSDQIEFSALLADNSVPHDALKFCFGGVRGKVFGENCCLTKHPLVFNGPEVSPAPHPHLSMGVRCADITGVVKHYKFAGDTAARDAASLGSGDLDHGEDAARAAVLTQTPNVTLFSLDARPWNRVELLIRAGFLVGSDAFTRYLQKAQQ